MNEEKIKYYQQQENIPFNQIHNKNLKEFFKNNIIYNINFM